VRYVEDMKKATLAEFDKAEVEWREIAERQVLHLCEIEDPLPTPEELDELGPDEAISRIESVVENNTQLCFAVDLWRASRRAPIKPLLNGDDQKDQRLPSIDSGTISGATIHYGKPCRERGYAAGLGRRFCPRRLSSLATAWARDRERAESVRKPS
jgi:hypothetical protein